MTDHEAATTLLARMTAAGISEERARAHIASGVVRVDGEEVTDPDAAAPSPTSWAIGPTG